MSHKRSQEAIYQHSGVYVHTDGSLTMRYDNSLNYARPRVRRLYQEQTLQNKYSKSGFYIYFLYKLLPTKPCFDYLVCKAHAYCQAR
jgi:hypothetical protein